jgi:hypothetical protein
MDFLAYVNVSLETCCVGVEGNKLLSACSQRMDWRGCRCQEKVCASLRHQTFEAWLLFAEVLSQQHMQHLLNFWHPLHSCRVMKLVGEDDLVREEKLMSEVVSKHVHSLVPKRKEQNSAGSETPQRPAMLAETSQSHVHHNPSVLFILLIVTQ